MNYNGYSNFRARIDNAEINLSDVVGYYLKRAAEFNHLNCFLELFSESAHQQAVNIQQKINHGTAGRLAGMVIALKDNICYKNHKVSAASNILKNYTSVYNATVIQKLLKEDAIIIGRCNCDEFAMGSSNENSAFGPVLNPLDTERVPGGSSGGSAAAVAAGLCMAALGSDTGGSIRQPASFTGTVGYKPTYGRVSRYGLIAYASSFDQIGPITTNVEDAALLMEILAGPDDYDSTAIPEEYSPVNHAEAAGKKYTFTFLDDCIQAKGVDPEIKEHFTTLEAILKREGHTILHKDFNMLEHLVPAYYVLTTAEASSNLARFDGIHYGYRSPNASDLDSAYKLSRAEGFGAEVKRRILLGTFVLSSGYYDAYYEKGQKVRRIIRNKMDELLTGSDFLVLPTSPITPFKLGDNTKDPISMYLQDIFTVKSNLSGNPAISLPLTNHSNKLPFGTQLIGKMCDDARLLACSKLLTDLFRQPV